MDSVEEGRIKDIKGNLVITTQEPFNALIASEDGSDPHGRLELGRYSRCFADTIKEPAEIWFWKYVHKNSNREFLVQIYIKAYKHPEEDKALIIVVVAALAGKDIFRIVEFDVREDNDYVNDNYRQGILIYHDHGVDMEEDPNEYVRLEYGNRSSGICWLDMEQRGEEDQLIVEDVRGIKFSFDNYKSLSLSESESVTDNYANNHKPQVLFRYLGSSVSNPERVIEAALSNKQVSNATKALIYIKSFEHPDVKSKKQYCIVITRENDGPDYEIVDVIITDDETEVNKYRKGILLYTEN